MEENWISVEDRLPEKGTLVLLCLSSVDEQKMTTGMLYLAGELEFNSKFNSKFDGLWCIGFDTLMPEFLKEEYVTHWMPLPKPPGGVSVV